VRAVPGVPGRRRHAGPRSADPMCSPGTVCRNGVCIPNDRDIDGDTFPASTDCDEQNPDVHPGGTEVCNAIDDDCSMTVDDGDPAVLCSGRPGRQRVRDGQLRVPQRQLRSRPDGAGLRVRRGAGARPGHVVRHRDRRRQHQRRRPGDERDGQHPQRPEVWYRFRGVDTPDSACDNYHVNAKLRRQPHRPVPHPRVPRRLRRADHAARAVHQVTGPPISARTSAACLTGQCPCWSGYAGRQRLAVRRRRLRLLRRGRAHHRRHRHLRRVQPRAVQRHLRLAVSVR
jgi:hypothetical protein